MHHEPHPVPDFIFMLTRADRTIADAVARLPEVLAAGVRHVGFKDVGLPLPALHRLGTAIRAAGATVYLEVVSLDAAGEAASARAAVDLGVDVLMGGTRPDVVLPIIAGTGIRYYPFPGEPSGHPSVLGGDVESIVASARALLAREGVHGLDLLAYRFAGDVEDLMARVCEAAGTRPVIVAGSFDRAERLVAALRAGAAGVTVGTAALDGLFPATDPGLVGQLAFIQDVVGRGVEKPVPGSPPPAVEKINLAAAFGTFSETWSPRVAGDVNSCQVKLAKFQGAFHWHHHEVEDELFLVVAGRLRMGFRDRAVDLGPGEFIVVPHGLEHRPEALGGECHVVLLEPGTTLNTGNVENDRTVRQLARLDP